VVEMLVEQPGDDRAGGPGQGAAQGGGGQPEPLGAGQAGSGSGSGGHRLPSQVRAGGVFVNPGVVIGLQALAQDGSFRGLDLVFRWSDTSRGESIYWRHLASNWRLSAAIGAMTDEAGVLGSKL
jgi:hypothetical protein